MQGKRFPRYLSAPYQILAWEADQINLFLGFMFLFMSLGSWWILPCTIIAPWQYGKFKKKNPRGFFHHLLYFVGISKLEGYPTFFEKEFVE